MDNNSKVDGKPETLCPNCGSDFAKGEANVHLSEHRTIKYQLGIDTNGDLNYIQLSTEVEGGERNTVDIFLCSECEEVLDYDSEEVKQILKMREVK